MTGVMKIINCKKNGRMYLTSRYLIFMDERRRPMPAAERAVMMKAMGRKIKKASVGMI